MAGKSDFIGQNLLSSYDFQCNLKILIQTYLQNYKKSNDRLCLSMKTRDLMDGDFVIPKGCLPDTPQEILLQMTDEIKQKSQNWSCPLRDIQIDTKFYTCSFFLLRADAFKNILTHYWYGDLIYKMQERCILLNHIDPKWVGSEGKNFSLDMLRSVILLQHTFLLLKSVGYNVKISTQCEYETLQHLLQLIEKDSHHLDIIDSSGLEKVKEGITQNLIKKAKKCCYLEQNSNDSLSLGDPSNCISCDGDIVTVNLKNYIDSKNYRFGKGYFDKNLHIVDVHNESGSTDILDEVARLHWCLSEDDRINTVIHIVPDSQQFTQQKLHLTWELLNDESELSQVHLVYGHTKSRKDAGDIRNTDAMEFFRMRYDQMKEAAVMKYGDAVRGSGWEDTITSLTVASLKFEFLNTVCRNMVKLDLIKDDSISGGDNRSGSFVMYNCARLSTLFTHFDDAVKKGLYAPLPCIEEVDFSTLREEDEWYLFFQYIFTYKDIIKQATAEFVPVSGEIHTKLQTHKICNFLVQLSHSLSSYYSRTHILGESRPHLLQTMYARIYLLKCIHKIMVHALSLMGISAINQL